MCVPMFISYLTPPLSLHSFSPNPLLLSDQFDHGFTVGRGYSPSNRSSQSRGLNRIRSHDQSRPRGTTFLLLFQPFHIHHNHESSPLPPSGVFLSSPPQFSLLSLPPLHCLPLVFPSLFPPQVSLISPPFTVHSSPCVNFTVCPTIPILYPLDLYPRSSFVIPLPQRLSPFPALLSVHTKG